MRLSTNLDLRAYAAAHNVALHEVAAKMGMAPATFSVQYMRMEQSDEVKANMKSIIEEIAKEKNNE